ncbi:MAG: DUF1573 domain-containing protein [Muribaculaceae bacterium]|nr:DUF1573 domain-containing protein [Muribaculaceae bacterium]
MKKILLLLVAVVMASVSLHAERKVPGQKVGVEFDKTSYDFGTVSEDADPVKVEFNIKVTGSQPVSILSATANCGCTTPKYDRAPIRPGKTSKVKVSFIPKGQRGEVRKDVRIRLRNGADKSETVTVKLTGVVVPEKSRK